MSEKLPPQKNYMEAEESEPYLGPWWTVFTLFLLGLKHLFPSEPWTLYWFLEGYIIILVVGITLFAIFKRWKFNQHLKQKEKRSQLDSK